MSVYFYIFLFISMLMLFALEVDHIYVGIILLMTFFAELFQAFRVAKKEKSPPK